MSYCDMCGVEFEWNGQYPIVCSACFESNYATCWDCGGIERRCDLHTVGSRLYCRSCHRQETWDPTPLTGIYDEELTSTRCFGVEVETSDCPDYEDMDRDLGWGAKYDCSVRGMEFVSGILSGDRGLQAIDDLCNVANTSGWEVNSECGLHVHLDMRSEPVETLCRIARAFLETAAIWRRVVDDDRYANSYCNKVRWSASRLNGMDSLSSFRNFAGSEDRFTWFNVCAYWNHKTFEIRCHQGSLDADEIKNWVKALLTFTDWVAKHTDSEVTEKFGVGVKVRDKFTNLCEIWEAAGCESLGDYYAARVSSEATWTPAQRVAV
jgi:hypothetical protein